MYFIAILNNSFDSKAINIRLDRLVRNNSNNNIGINIINNYNISKELIFPDLIDISGKLIFGLIYSLY